MTRSFFNAVKVLFITDAPEWERKVLAETFPTIDVRSLHSALAGARWDLVIAAGDLSQDQWNNLRCKLGPDGHLIHLGKII